MRIQNAVIDAWTAAWGGQDRGGKCCRNSQEEGAELMKIKEPHWEEVTEERKGAGGEPRLRKRTWGGNASGRVNEKEDEADVRGVDIEKESGETTGGWKVKRRESVEGGSWKKLNHLSKSREDPVTTKLWWKTHNMKSCSQLGRSPRTAMVVLFTFCTLSVT